MIKSDNMADMLKDSKENMMTKAAIDIIKNSRKQVRQNCNSKSERALESLEDLDIDLEDEEVIEWLTLIKNDIKIKEVND